MPYQPTHPHPYLESVDAKSSEGYLFSVVINPKDVISKYDFVICSSDTKESLYETTETFETSSYVYGTEEGTTLPIKINGSLNSLNEQFVNGTNYSWYLKLYSPNNTSIETQLYYFTTKSTPKIEFNVDSTLHTCEYTFTATYEQNENEPYMYYQYLLYRDGLLIDSTPEKMDSLLSYKYSGFVSGYKYQVELLIRTQDNHIYKLIEEFDVQYESQNTAKDPVVELVADKNCINIDFSKNLFIKGNTNGDISYQEYGTPETNALYIANVPSEESIYYHKINERRPLSIGDEFTAYYSVNFAEFFVGDIITLTDENTASTYNVRYDGRKFYYKIGDNSEVSIDPYVDSNDIHQETSVVHNNVANLTSEEVIEVLTVNFGGLTAAHKILVESGLVTEEQLFSGTIVEIPIEKIVDAVETGVLLPEAAEKILSILLNDLSYDTLYMLYDNDEIQDDSVIMYNDITSNFWWTFVLLPDKVLVSKGKLYSESVVS